MAHDPDETPLIAPGAARFAPNPRFVLVSAPCQRSKDVAAQTNFEVYSYTRGRWTLHAQFSAKKMAVGAAESLFRQPAIDAVSVIEERYDSGSGRSNEYTAFSDAKHDSVPALRGKPVRPSGDKKSREFTYHAPRPEAAKRAKPKEPSPTPRAQRTEAAAPNPFLFTAKIIGVLVFGVLIAWAAATGLASIDYGAALIGGSAGAASPDAWTIVFLVVLVAFLVFTFSKTVSRAEISALLGTGASPGGARRSSGARRPSAAATADAEAGTATPTPTPVRPSEVAEPLPQPAEAGAGLDESAPEVAEAAGGGDAPGIEAAAVEAKAIEEAAGDLTDGEEDPVEGARLTIIGFLGHCFSYLEREDLHLTGGRLDGYNAFGCNLFLAGACEGIAKTRELSEEGARKVLEDCLDVLIQNPERAGRFAEKYEEYLLEPGYCDMFEAGRRALDAFVEEGETGDDSTDGEDAEYGDDSTDGEDAEVGARLANALAVWNKEETAAVETGTVAVMFTKILGVDEVTGEHGDAAARELTAAHDAVVRAAIEAFGGREIKHLGDGIMASFRQTYAAVDAAVRMQREAHQDDRGEARRDVRMCVGINAGEPIAEDDDLFGATVQIAARMCAAAAEGEIMVSNAVRALCDGKGLSFADIGTREFKGVEEPLDVYAADWQLQFESGRPTVAPSPKPRS